MNPQELAQFQRLQSKAQQVGLTPIEAMQFQQLQNKFAVMQLQGGQGVATLNPPNDGSRVGPGGVTYEEVPMAEPRPWMPIDTNIAWMLNDRVVSLTAGTINVEQPINISFDLDTRVYALTASCYSTAGAAVPATGFPDSLSMFRVQFKMAQGRQFQTTSAPGITVLGTGQRPRYLGRPAWRFQGGSTLVVNVTPLAANLQIDIVLYAVEIASGNNISQIG